tara:strand:- start:346 stop:1005 length:660 start_codon:yes stop_codon:yes gene_type:complete
MNKRLTIALVLLLLLSTYKVQNFFDLSSTFRIKEISIENNLILNDSEIKQALAFLYETNILLLQTEKIKTELDKVSFIESFEIKKIYPNSIKIKILEKKPIAILQNKKQKNFYTDKGKLISFDDFDEFKNLPFVFGDKDSFLVLHTHLKEVNFPLNDIKTFFLFKSNRWDIITQKNQTLKLPIDDYKKSLKNFLIIKDQVNFEKYKTFDYRINNQLILK